MSVTDLYIRPHSWLNRDSFVTHSWLIHVWHMTVTDLYVRHDSFTSTILPQKKDGVPAVLSCDSLMCFIYGCDWFIRETWLLHIYSSPKKKCCCNSFVWLIDMCEIWLWLICTWDMTPSHLLYSKKKLFLSFVGVTYWYVLDMAVTDLCNDSFICVTWLIHMCDMTHA